MSEEEYRIRIEAPDEAAAAEGARRLADDLRELPGVLAADRRKADESTMDLGSIVGVIAASGATTAVAQGIADWLRRRRGTRLMIERKDGSGSIKVVVESIDPDAALRITELIGRV
ncbi:MAG TPA: hypothetical protein VJ779_21225 [Acetobacteraceae bacterium]|nr:hypothetical protein [Acetobacteraceae bacterium]